MSSESTDRPIVTDFANGAKPIPAAALSNPDADLLENALKRGQPVTMKLALDCGIGNLSHFYTLFRHETGTTPRRYRLAHRRPV